MNPVSAASAAGRAHATQDTSQVPSDLAGLFAMMFAATTAAPPPLQPTPVVMPAVSGMGQPARAPEGMEAVLESLPEGTPSAEGEGSSTLSGGWPGRDPSGLQAFPGLATTGRPHLERSGLTPALEVLTPVRRDLLESLRSPEPAISSGPPINATPARSAAVSLPAGLPVPGPMDQVPMLAAALAAALPASAGTPGSKAPPTDVPDGGRVKGGDATASGEPLLADAAFDGGRGARRGAMRSSPLDAAAAGLTGRGRGKSGSGAAAQGDKPASDVSKDALTSALPDVTEIAVPSAPGALAPQAHLAGVTPPHSKLPDLPVSPGAAPAAPVELPPEPQSLASPSHATVSFDSGDGQEGRLRVSLRGETLRATIQMPDAAAAQRLEQDLGELSRALRGHGFEDARLTIDAPRSTSNSERGHDDTQRREQKNQRDERSHSGERNSARRERGTSRQER